MLVKTHKSFKYRMYPTEHQKTMFAKTFGCCRFIYNKMLADKIEAYQTDKVNLKTTPAQYKQEFQWLKEVHSDTLCYEQLHLEAAYSNFFKGLKSGKNIGFPKFKSKKHSKKSFTISGIRIENSRIHLPKIGDVKFVEHRIIPDGYKLKSATITETPSGKYYVSVLTEYMHEIPEYQIDTSKSLGLDYSTPEFYVDSQGRKPEGFVKLFKQSEDRLAKEQRKLSRMKYESNNYEKQRIRVAKIHEHIANQRKDFIEKESTKLSRMYDVICVEDINLQNQAQSLKLGKSTNDNGFGAFRDKLQYKLEFQGKEFVKIDRWTPTSTVCNCCGSYHKDIVHSLDIREWTCPDCGTHHDRDENAALNILIQGLSLL